jgi:hypothetical protein
MEEARQHLSHYDGVMTANSSKPELERDNYTTFENMGALKKALEDND